MTGSISRPGARSVQRPSMNGLNPQVCKLGMAARAEWSALTNLHVLDNVMVGALRGTVSIRAGADHCPRKLRIVRRYKGTSRRLVPSASEAAEGARVLHGDQATALR